MLLKSNLKKKNFFPALILSSLILSACTPSSNHHLEVNLVKNVVTSQKQSGVDYSKAIVATNPQLDEVKYVNENYTKYLAAAQTALKQAAPEQTFSEAEVIAVAKKLVQPEAADYVHFKYIADRSFSLNWTTLKPGSLFYGGSYGTGWIVDRFKNSDGSWSNDFLVSTNIHVLNTIDSGSGGLGSSNLYNGFPDDIYELAINNQVYDPVKPNSDWVYSSSYAKLPNWSPDNYFRSSHRSLVNQVANAHETRLYYSFSFAGPVWRPDLMLAEEGFLESGTALGANTSLTSSSNYINADSENWYGAQKLTDYLLSKLTLTSKGLRYYNSIFFDPSNIDIEKAGFRINGFFRSYARGLLNQTLIENGVSQVFNSVPTLDNGYIRVTIPDDVLVEKLPVFLDPSKYNEWTFPKFSQRDAFKNYSYHDFKQSYGYLDGQSSGFDLLPEQQETIWHAGYPAEQTWNGLAYRSPGPIFKTSVKQLTSISLNNPNFQNNLDHNQCNFYNSLCNNDGVSEGGYSLGAENADTGGGSSGSMALNQDYEVQGIYWGVQYNSGSLLDYASTGLYAPMYSSSALNPSYFQAIPSLTTQNKGATAYTGSSSSASVSLRSLLNFYLRNGLEKTLIEAKSDDTFEQVLNFNKLNSFDYTIDLEPQITALLGKINGDLDTLKKTHFDDSTSNLNGLSPLELKDRLYTGIKSAWRKVFNQTASFSSAPYLQGWRNNYYSLSSIFVAFIDRLHQVNMPNLNLNFTAFAKRDLGTVNMAAELQNYFQKNNYKSHVYNNANKPLKIVDVQA